ncbi:MAG TPA: DUF4832 domain-containing protein [Sphingobacterium sp.]|nr:DUF4832 domain-containing protein [Sphingobacterium sp.]
MKKLAYITTFLTFSITLLFVFVSIPLGSLGQSKADDQYVVISPPYYSKAFRNPMKGLREFFLKGVDPIRADYPYPYGSMIKEYIPWNMIEDHVSDDISKVISYCNYRWKDVEKHNIKVIPRVYIVWIEPWHGGKAKDPNNIDDLNGWHWPKDIPGQNSPYKQIPGSWGAYIEIQDSITPITGGYFTKDFPQRVENLVQKIGQAWDNDPRVAYVEMGIIGEWGEHHDPNISTFWPPHDEPKHVDNRTWIPGIEEVLGRAFTQAFKNKKVMVRYAYEFKDYDFGIYWDSWSQKEEQERGYQAMRDLGDRWKTQVIGGEITWNWGSLAKFKSFEEVVNDKEYMDITIEQIRNLHCNHLGGITWANFDDPVFKINADSLQRALGYRFVIDEVRYPKVIKNNKIDFSFTVHNEGSSPFYYNWPIELVLLDTDTKKKVWGTTLENTDITQWMPGEKWHVQTQKYLIEPERYAYQQHVSINKKIKPGKYILALTVLDPAGMKPSLRFANKSYVNGGYTALGYIGIDTAISGHKIEDQDWDDLQADRGLHYTLKN